VTAPFRRAVFFIAGFDPNGAQYLYWLFRQEIGKDNALYGRTTEIGRLTSDADGLPGWRIETADAGRAVTVDYTVLSPRRVVVGNYYVRDVFRLIAAYVYVLFAFVRTGGILYLRKAPLPALLVVLYVILAVPGFFWIGTTLAHWPMLLLPDGTGEAWRLLGRVLGGLVFLQAVYLAERVIWLYFFVSALRMLALQAEGRAHALDRMVEDWARIVARRHGERRYDEVLVVGHSIGTIQGIEMAERLLRDPAFAGRLSLLTIGSADALLSCQRNATRFHAAIAAAATSPDLVWVEYWAPTDAICRGWIDPVAFAAIDLGGRPQRGPAMRKVDLGAMFPGLNPRRVPLNLVKQHFLYLSAGAAKTEYSYFKTICAAKRLS
jgi:pimeloyl-ACP methyl ester carboxylesterase